jgi:predicted small metal-binding protein
MAQTVGCSDFNQDCSFRITADDGQEDMMVDVATSHALKFHREFAPTETEFRNAIRSQIKSLLTQAHVSPNEMADFIK